MSKNARGRVHMPHSDQSRRTKRRFVEQQLARLQRKLSKMAKGRIRASLNERAAEEAAKPEEAIAESLAESN